MEIRFSSRIAIVLNDRLLSWQRLNVTAFLASGIAAQSPDLIGRPYRDKHDVVYCPMFVRPVIIYQAGGDALLQLLVAARQDDLVPALFTWELFETNNDHDNRASVARFATEELSLAGIGLSGPRNVMNRLLEGIPRHP